MILSRMGFNTGYKGRIKTTGRRREGNIPYYIEVTSMIKRDSLKARGSKARDEISKALNTLLYQEHWELLLGMRECAQAACAN